jgi:serine/threonine-protein kinase
MSVAGAIEPVLRVAEGRRQREEGQSRRLREAEHAVRPILAARPEDHSPSAEATIEALPSGSATADAMIVTPHRLASAGEPLADSTAPEEELTTEPVAVDETVLSALWRRLAYHVGPIAKVLVDSAARKAQSVEELCKLLAEEIDSPGERRDFLREALRECSMYAAAMKTRRPPITAGSGLALSGGTGSVPAPTAIPPEIIELARAEMTRVIGPLARLLVKRLLPSCTTTAELWARLAEHIEQPAERAAFMRRRP